MCSYVFVFCHVSKSFFCCCCLYNSFSSSSSTAAGIPAGLDVFQPRPTKPNPALSLWRLGRRAGLLSRWLERPPRNHLRVFRPRWVMTSGQNVPLYPPFRRSAPDQIPNLTLPTQMGSMVDKPVTSSGNCPTDNANGLPSPRSRQKSFLGFKFKRTGLGLTGSWVGCCLDPPCRGQQIKHSQTPVRRQKERARNHHHPTVQTTLLETECKNINQE